ncbi:hypothetical protein BAC1_00244 [uncultured bacterium]|nr:hypothetical protein BAC1_00244 [uncultured bacterium]
MLIFWLLAGYLFLFIFRPYEYWPVLGQLHIERVYMLALLLALLTWKYKKYVPHRINASVLVFFFVMILSSITAVNSWDSYYIIVDYLKLIVFYFVIIAAVKDEKDLRNFILAYILIMFLYVGKSSWEFFINDRYWFRMGIKRLMGIDVTYGDPNYLAASIAYSLPFLWAMIKYKLESRPVRLLLWAYGVLALVAVIYTGSRSGMVTVLLFMVLMWISGSKKMIGALILSAALFVSWSTMPDDYQMRFLSIFDAEAGDKGADLSAKGRIEGLKAGINIFTNKPLLGIGPGNFKYGWEKVEVGGSAHNLYGQILGETGGAGFLAFFILVILIVKTHLSVIKRTGQLLKEKAAGLDERNLLFLRYASIASVQTIVLLLFNGNFGHNLYRYNYLWVGAMGVLASYFIARLDSPSPRTARIASVARGRRLFSRPSAASVSKASGKPNRVSS